MAYTLDQLSALEEAIASGALRVRYSDREVTYQSLDAMRKLRAEMRQELGLSASGSGVRRVATFSKGLC